MIVSQILFKNLVLEFSNTTGTRKQYNMKIILT